MNRCPVCSHPVTRVVLTTSSTEGEIVRRRCCSACGARFYTVQPAERPLPNSAIQWLGRHGRRGIQLRPEAA